MIWIYDVIIRRCCAHIVGPNRVVVLAVHEDEYLFMLYHVVGEHVFCHVRTVYFFLDQKEREKKHHPRTNNPQNMCLRPTCCIIYSVAKALVVTALGIGLRDAKRVAPNERDKLCCRPKRCLVSSLFGGLETMIQDIPQNIPNDKMVRTVIYSKTNKCNVF